MLLEPLEFQLGVTAVVACVAVIEAYVVASVAVAAVITLVVTVVVTGVAVIMHMGWLELSCQVALRRTKSPVMQAGAQKWCPLPTA